MFFLNRCLALSMFCAVSVQAMDIVKNGKPSATIVTGDKASQVEKFVAADLQRAILKISDAKLKLAVEPSSDAPRIVIGTPQSNREIAAKTTLLGLNKPVAAQPDFIVIRNIGNVLYLTGNSREAARDAVYTWLTQLGARWFWPGEDGEYLPRQKNISVDNLNIAKAPSFNVRMYQGFFHETTALWLARNRISFGKLNEQWLEKYGFLMSWGGHSYGHIFPKDCKNIQEYFSRYPDHFSMIGGKRVLRQHCYSNPEVRKVFLDWILNFWKTHPQYKRLCLAPLDNPHYCRCPECSKLDPSTNFHNFNAYLITEANKKYPGKQYRTYAYSFYRDAPRGIKYPSNTVVAYCMYGRCYKHKFDDKSCKVNEKSLKRLDSWLNTGMNVSIYGYHYDALSPNGKKMYFLPLAPIIDDELKYLNKHGIKEFGTEIVELQTRYGHGKSQVIIPRAYNLWFACRFSLYAMARLTWDVSLNLDDLLNEYAEKVYGPAAPEMIKYYKIMQQAWQGKGHLSYYFSSPEGTVDNFISAGVISGATEALNQAVKTLQRDRSTTGKRALNIVESDRKTFELWKTMAESRNSWAGIAESKGKERIAFMKTAKPGRSLFAVTPDACKAGSVPPYFTGICTVRQDAADQFKYIHIAPNNQESLAFGHHPRFIRQLVARNWINYETSFKFRFPEKSGRNPYFAVQLRSGGIRFGTGDKYLYIGVDFRPNGCSAVVRNRKAKPSFIQLGHRTWRELNMPSLEPGKWHEAKIRLVDCKLYVWVEREGKMIELLDCNVPLGGGYVNFLTYKNFVGTLDIADLELKEIPSPSRKKQWNLDVPLIEHAPVIDGKGDDACWAQAWKTADGFRNRGKDNRKVKTEIAVCRTNSALFLKFACHSLDKLKANKTKRDDDQWSDDCIELCLDPQNTRTDYYYLVVNSLGVQYDALASTGLSIDKGWNGKWHAATSKDRDSWTLEVELPFTTFGKPDSDATWLLGINRSGENIRQSWTDGSYHNPNSFKTLRFK